jgi:hypothetical protein
MKTMKVELYYGVRDNIMMRRRNGYYRCASTGGQHLLVVRARFQLRDSPCSIPSGKNGIGAAFPLNTYFIIWSRGLLGGRGN